MEPAHSGLIPMPLPGEREDTYDSSIPVAEGEDYQGNSSDRGQSGGGLFDGLFGSSRSRDNRNSGGSGGTSYNAVKDRASNR